MTFRLGLLILSMEDAMLRPFAARSAVDAIHRLREHSRRCHDLAAREYLIRVERRIMALILEDTPPSVH
ncbi:hypothetical protein TSO5_03365 [Azospirillum sp. TSO5]|nr:hypothetical protein TSO5_03365 [Azospirillum sp. TSO5]